MSDEADRLTLYPSLRGLLAVLLTPYLLIGLGAWGLVGAGGVVAGAFVAAGIATAALGLYGYPHRIVVSTAGIDLVAVLRRRRLPWSDIRAITRTPSSRARLRPGAVAADGGPPAVRGGLVIRGPGRRRTLLTDRTESAAEFDRLCAIVGAAGVTTHVRATRPDETTPPTWRYRRRRPRPGRPHTDEVDGHLHREGSAGAQLRAAPTPDHGSRAAAVDVPDVRVRDRDRRPAGRTATAAQRQPGTTPAGPRDAGAR